MRLLLWKRTRGVDRSRRVFAAYLVVVFAVAMTAQGFAAPPHAGEKPGRDKKEAAAAALQEPAAPADPEPSDPVLAAPQPEAPVRPDASETPAGASTEQPLPTQPSGVLLAAAPVVGAGDIGPLASVTPVLIPGNPALGDGGIRIEPPQSGTYHYDDAKEVNEPGVPDDFELVITVSPDGRTFSFTCNYRITQVIVKGGPDAYAYNYPGGTYGDSGLVSPTTDNGSVPGLSHMLFYFAQGPPTAQIAASKFHDDGEGADFANGTRDGDAEEWLGDFTFELYSGASATGPWAYVESATSVLPNGVADFGMHPSGWYKIVEVLSADQIAAGWYCTTGGGETIFETNGEDDASASFGNVQTPDEQTGDLRVYKYLDGNRNGEYDDGEEMLEGWVFTLTRESAPVGPARSIISAMAPAGIGSTDEDGELLFPHLAVGEYAVTETLEDGWTNTTPLKQYAEVVNGATAELWFGNAPVEEDPETGDLVIHKYEDVNENQVRDPGEAMLADWEFTVVNPAGVIANQVSAAVALIGSGTTGADGTLSFTDLDPGTLTVTETLQDGWESTTGLTRQVEIVAGQTTHVWFGNVEEFLRFTELDLAITKVADDHSVDEGQLVTYTLTYWNLMDDEDALDYTIVDDYDERYLTIVDAAGGAVAGGKITWTFPGPLAKSDGKQTITYTARVIADMPDRTTNIDNVVVIDDDRDFNPDNDSDDERVVYTPDDIPDDPFLPFTGGEYLTLIGLAVAAAVLGLLLRLRTDNAT